MYLSSLRLGIIKLSVPRRYGKCVQYLTDHRNILVSSGQNDKDILFHFNITSEISTSSIFLKGKDKYKEKKKVVHVDLNEMATVVKVESMLSQFDKVIENFKEHLIKHVGVRTRTGAIEELPVEYESKKYNLEELVEIGRRSNMVILNVAAFPEIIPDVLKALRNSQMNLNPQQEGTTIYITIPKVTKEHRESLLKVAKQHFVKCKVAISDIRNEHAKQLQKNDTAPKDLIFKAESYINTMQKSYVDKANMLLKAKEKELIGES